MRKFLSRFLPHHESVKNNRWLKPFGDWLHHPDLWHLHRRSVAGGVAVGMFCGLMPGPLQMLSATLLSVLFRVNLPVSLLTTLYTNPLTIVPLYMLAYQIGAWVSGVHNGMPLAPLVFPTLQWNNWASEMWTWLVALGQPILIGLPLLAVILAIVGYVVVRLAWRVLAVFKWRARKRRN